MASQVESSNVPVPVISNLDFCPWCGSILPFIPSQSVFVRCQRCQFERNVKEYVHSGEEFTIYFNTETEKDKKIEEQGLKEDVQSDFTGPTVERQCPKCNHDIMTYTTRQTRSADEGQTVFYTCVHCKFQDIEYS